LRRAIGADPMRAGDFIIMDAGGEDVDAVRAGAGSSRAPTHCRASDGFCRLAGAAFHYALGTLGPDLATIMLGIRTAETVDEVSSWPDAAQRLWNDCADIAQGCSHGGFVKEQVLAACASWVR
jgi:hypothetical protein